MISIPGFELPSPPPTAKEIRQWGKWREEMILFMEAAQLKQKTTLGKGKKKNIKKKKK